MNNEKENVLIKVYAGKSVAHLCTPQLHPVHSVEAALFLITQNKSTSVYSNDTDFISAIKYIGNKNGVKTEFYLDGVNHGSDIDPLFGDFNKAMDLIWQYGSEEFQEKTT